jgi:hypothetical protein
LICYWIARILLSVMSKSEIINRIGDHLSLLAKVVRTGFESIEHHYSDTAEVHTKRTTANLRYDHMIRTAKEILPKKDFHPIRAGRRSLFSFRDKILVQFKKLKRNLMTSNYPTKQADFFDKLGMVPSPSLPGIEESLPLISVGYVAKDAHGLEGIFITRVVNHKPEWAQRIDDEPTEEQQPPIISILPPNDPVAPKRSRIRRTRKPSLPDTRTPRS